MKAQAGSILDRTPLLLVGEFGSGKSELALQLAVDAVGDQVVLVDLDMITPFFRSREMRDELCRRGIRLVAPSGRYQGTENPLMPPGVVAALQGAGRCIVDVGGGEAGIRVLGSLRPVLQRTQAACVMVANPYRPGTGTPGEIAARAEGLQRAGRVRLDGLFANPNLGELTEPAILHEGLQVVTQAARELGMPVVGVGLTEGLQGHPDTTGILEDSGHRVVVIRPRLSPDRY